MINDMKNVIDLLEHSAKAYGDRIAFIDYEKKITYSELAERSKKVASIIISKKIKNKPIVVFTRRDIETIILIFGVIYSGNIYIPVDSSQPDEKIKAVLEMADTNVILCNKEDVRSIEYHKDIYFFTISGKGEISSIYSDEIDKIRNDIIDTDPISCFLTSGTTGKPKGVLKSHQSILSMIKIFVEKFDFSDKDVFGCQSSFDFDVSNKSVFISIYLGSSVFIIPNNFFIFPGKLIPSMDKYKVTVLIWSVSALSLLAKIKVLQGEKPHYLKKVMFSGETISYTTLRYWQENLPNVLFVNLYGPTEMTGNSLFYVVNKICENKPLPIGKPLPDTRIYLLDERQHIINEKNINGEIYISGKCLAMCYYNDFSKTAEAFIQNPLNSSYPEIIYRTGDIGYINDNNDYVFVGRKDLQIKRNGYRIELTEIENIVYDSGLVSLCCCIYNKECSKMILYYQHDSDKNKELYELLKKKLSGYMMPDKIVRLDKIPLNSHDKVDREVLMRIENESVL